MGAPGTISWLTRRRGTRSTWCGSATAKRPAAGATTRICSPTGRLSVCGAPRRGVRRPPPAGGPGWMRTCPTWRWRRSPPLIPSSWPSTRSVVHCPAAGSDAGSQAGPGPSACPGPLPTQHQPRAVRAVGAATETGTTPRRQRVASQTGHQPGRDLAARADGVPLRAYRHDTLSQRYRRLRVITPPNPAAPVRPNRPGPATSPPGSSAPTATPSPSRTPTSARGRGCGASGSPCSAQACSSRPWPRMPGHRWSTTPGRHPHHRHVPALPVRAARRQDLGPTHP